MGTQIGLPEFRPGAFCPVIERAVVFPAPILSKVYYRPVSRALRILDDDVAEQFGMGTRPGGLSPVHQIKIPVGEIVNIGVLDTRKTHSSTRSIPPFDTRFRKSPRQSGPSRSRTSSSTM